MPLEFEGKVVLVTGAAKGIGRATAEMFAREGASTIVTDLDNQVHELEAVLKGLGSPEVLTRSADVGSSSSVDDLVGEAIVRFGRIDVLVNVAGIYPTCRLIDMSDEFFQRVMDVNLYGTFRFCRAVVPRMMAAGRGAVVNIASGAAFRPLPGLTAYSASKSAVVALSRVLALESAPTVRVNVVAPGATATEAVLAAHDAGDNEAVNRSVRGIPLGRMATPSEISDAILFLASDRSAFVTGQILGVNGGSLMA